MSTQDESGIEFSVVPEENQQHFRLLELPAELLAVLTSENAPMLQLKSQEGPPGHSSDSSAVLCTPNKTYSIRQVSTSNEVYVTHPISISNESLSAPVLEAIAQCTSTLELQPAKNVSAVPHIKAVLPTYASTGHYDSKEAISKEQLFGNIPLSDAECEQGWLELACFELEDPPRSLVPSDGMRLKVWRAISETATAMSVDLTQVMDAHNASNITDSNYDWPNELSIAVLRSMSSGITSRDIKLDETLCAQAIGQMLLKEQTNSASKLVPLSLFKAEWADLLPEIWRAGADISLLNSCCRLENGGKDVNFVDDGAGARARDAANGATPDEAKSTLGAKRKWHEKFRASKKTA